MFETLRTILVDTLQVRPDDVRPEATKEELDLDSLSVVELAMILEKDHGVRISDEELQAVDTLGDIVALMEQRSVAS
jgi:acyl carrier protein